MKKLSVIVMAFVLLSGLSGLQAQTKIKDIMYEDGYNKYSLRPVHESDIMYRKTLIRALDLREKQNKPIFSEKREITRIFIEAVENGIITPYRNDSLEDGGQLTIAEFKEAIEMPSSEPELSPEEKEIMLQMGDSSFMYSSGTEYYFPRDLYQMEIKEDLLFDKERSRMYYDIIAITLFVPADHGANIKGIQLPIASFSYKEVTEKLFKDNPEAIWYNPQNDASHINLADAFELRLFSSYIIRVSNPMNQYLVDIYGGDQQKGIMASSWAAHDLLEYEHNLWEF
ncbi:gliding motility protein GldN [Cytophagaceae bacterium ABcell3]|nr:gliding motility protein GldN [Cytophagaceae bacterium ABcell3]